MSKDKLKLLSPLFLKHQADFEKNPRSRVFAPLAEAYRKIGMTNKAMEILSHGIRIHPTYLMGYLGLAFCYYDLKQFNLTYTTLRPFIELNRDNLRLQKLFSDVCLELGNKDEALETLKYLLFINPRDKNIAELVFKVEKEVDDQYISHHEPIIIPEHELRSEKLTSFQSASENDFDNWMTLDLNQENNSNDVLTTNFPKTTNYEDWNLEKGIQLDFQNDADPLIETAQVDTNKATSTDLNDNAPLVTHTLVDLYCGQGHIEKALEVLGKILLLNPNDQKTIKKIQEIQDLMQPLDEANHEQYSVNNQLALPVTENTTEADGRRNLMNLIDERREPIKIEEDNGKIEIAQLLEKKLSLFLTKIQKRALDYQATV